MEQDNLRFEDATARAAEALAELIDALGTRLPQIAAITADCRVTYDLRAQVLMVCPIRPDGTSAALLALRCDPDDPETFGRLAVPVSVKGLYGPATQH